LLQTHKSRTGENRFELLTHENGKGFDRIPEPDAGDLFFDMEGDPLYPDGLEYLFGVYYEKQNQYQFKAFWAHDHVEEKRTFEEFVDFISTHLQSNPRANVYHYNHYETTALKRLACRYATREEVIDQLLRTNRFIDLYPAVRESLRTSESGYSIKNLETFYREKRSEAVSTAAESIVIYNEWRSTGDSHLLQDISDYNEVDCVSTKELRDWLLSIKPRATLRPQSQEGEDTEYARKPWEIEYEEYQEKISACAGIPEILKDRTTHLLEFHKREEKPQWWSRYDRKNKFEDELLDDAECIAGLTRIGDPEPLKRSLVYTYQFPAQEFKLRVKDKPVDVSTLNNVGEIISLDETENYLKLKLGKNATPPPERFSIGPGNPISSEVLRKSLYRYAAELLQHYPSDQVATEILTKNSPRLKGYNEGAPIVHSDNILLDTLQAIEALQSSYLFIQGPPGAGKTYTTGQVIVSLMQKGKKIGISSNSHHAIMNIIDRVEQLAKERDFNFKGYRKVTNLSDPMTESSE